MTSLFEADTAALQALITMLSRTEQEATALLYSLGASLDAFDHSFISPDKANFEDSMQTILRPWREAIQQMPQVQSRLVNLLNLIQEAEQVTF